MSDDMLPASEVYAKLKHQSAVLSFILVFGLVFTMSLTSVVIWQSYRAGQQASSFKALADQNHDVLCSFKLDLKRRYDEGRQYLADHPDGILNVISADELRRSLNNQRSVLIAFANLDCVVSVDASD